MKTNPFKKNQLTIMNFQLVKMILWLIFLSATAFLFAIAFIFVRPYFWKPKVDIVLKNWSYRSITEKNKPLIESWFEWEIINNGSTLYFFSDPVKIETKPAAKEIIDQLHAVSRYYGPITLNPKRRRKISTHRKFEEEDMQKIEARISIAVSRKDFLISRLPPIKLGKIDAFIVRHFLRQKVFQSDWLVPHPSHQTKNN